ncbi:cupin domain-containing protein [Streptomyces sp. NPDC051014]|uniref:cupin domain-containing protein n=1 Tax=Streptomyces sp. NPDC051014 TaxID=3155751 RepID=UPI0033D40D00
MNIPSRTVNLPDVEFEKSHVDGRDRGMRVLQHCGPTPATKHLEVGLFELLPHEEPHAKHTHLEEELLVVTRGRGEIECGEVRREVGPGSVTYVAPHVPHSIRNTGEETLTFHWIKWRN